MRVETIPVRVWPRRGVRYVALDDVVELLRLARILVVEEEQGDAKRIGVDHALSLMRSLQELPDPAKGDRDRDRRWRKVWTGA